MNRKICLILKYIEILQKTKRVFQLHCQIDDLHPIVEVTPKGSRKKINFKENKSNKWSIYYLKHLVPKSPRHHKQRPSLLQMTPSRNVHELSSVGVQS
jgi:hypothetical protein